MIPFCLYLEICASYSLYFWYGYACGQCEHSWKFSTNTTLYFVRNSFRKFVETPAETLAKICQSMNYLLISWNMWTGSCTNLVWRCPILMIACMKFLILNHFVLWDKFNHFNNVLVEFQQGFWATWYIGIGTLGCYDFW